MAYRELYNMLEQADTMAKNLANQIDNPDKDYSLGTNPSTD